MDSSSTIVPVQLKNGAKIRVEVTPVGFEQNVGAGTFRFDDLSEAIEGIADTVLTSLKRAAPQRAEVELGIELGVESGALTALLVKGTGKANLKVKLGWDFPAK
jgi:hypothetical protein